MTTLVGIILTYNETAHVSACIESLRFCDEVIVFDSFSTDDTVVLSKQAGARVIQHKFSDYASQRNAALEAVRDGADWVLFVDADERVTPQLAEEVRHVIELPSYAAWQIPRHNYIFGKLTQGAGWYPDYQTRLLRVGKAHYDPARPVHETAVLNGKLGSTDNPFVHYNYRDAEQFAEKQQRYSAYDARILFEQGVRPRLRQWMSMPLRQFWWRFVTLKGYRDGLHGLHLSVLMAWYELRKYRLLWQLWRQDEVERG
ncbi:MAG: glycosyltransferase family 2 protein [Anaerolineae bacterium]|nr:glycosyltransferase family 2 protein [Anaerolineae bacterium]